MSRKNVTALARHSFVCLLFPIFTNLGFKAYTLLFGAPLSRGIAIGLAIQLIFAVFVLANCFIALATTLKAKIALACALVIANLAYLLPQHPLRALLFAGLSGGLTCAAVYITRGLALSTQALR